MQAAPCTAFTLKQPVRLVLTFLPPLPYISSADPISLIRAIHNKSMKAGVAISPDTPSTAITDELGHAADLLLVMTVYPGPSPPHLHHFCSRPE